ncbi:hypothetical protein POTOM_004450 [Populus tomentosa]|uniref:Uncharacterized protein n=1 Tax=Populus tomentosa TaxID=118781 RepID=A0A8X8AJU8_POPTO|nr:hypothetical protein POTOM_004450 [Populus tomentosa]
MVTRYNLQEQKPQQDNLNRGQLEIAGGSFSTPFIARDQAYSFTYESPVTGDCPRIAVEKGDFLFDAKVTDSKLDAIHGEVFPGKLPALSDTLVPVNRGIGERMQKIEIPQGGFNGSILSSIHGRRNHTIGPGKLDQL